MPLAEWDSLPKREVSNSSNPITTRVLGVINGDGRLLIHYTGGGNSTVRVIKPKRVFTVDSPRWPSEYIEAFCELRHEDRVFDVAHIALIGGPSDSRFNKSESRRSGSVRCAISFVDLEGDYGSVEGVQAECSRCGHVTESFGTDSPSVRRCLLLMRQECPNGEQNYYDEE